MKIEPVYMFLSGARNCFRQDVPANYMQTVFKAIICVKKDVRVLMFRVLTSGLTDL
jgi:hypothetical protein